MAGDSEDDIYKAGKLLLETSIRLSTDKTASQICKVTGVDRERRTCSLYYFAGDVEYLECRLCSVIDPEGETITTLYPKVGSYVQAIPSEKNRSVWLVIAVHQTDGIELNGNKYSMAKAEELQQQLNKTNAVLQAILDSISSWAVTPNDGGGALKSLLSANLAGKTLGEFSNIVNENVKHG